MFVVVKNSKAKGVEAVWVFTDHDDALRCRREQKLDSHHLWGCTPDCYKFENEK